MRTSPRSISLHPLSIRKPLIVALSAAAAALALNPSLTAQSTSPVAPTAASPTAPHRSHPVHHAAKTEQAPTPVPAPEPPPAPKWPMNDQPVPASVNWDSGGLRIIAANSSLQQILAEFAKSTGTKVDGMAQDQRIFGNFGPGKPSDVLAELLHGSGYNFLLVGDTGSGLPREVILSAQATGAVAQRPNVNQQQEDDYDDTPDNQVDTQPQAPPVVPPGPPHTNGTPDGMPVRTPQQIMQDLQMRQQQLQQQQQQQQPGTQPNN